MIQEAKLIPQWVLIVSGLFAVLAMVVTSTLLFLPQSVLRQVDLNAKGVNYLIYMWAARQFSVGFIFGFATFRRSASMLTIAYLFFLIMNICDVFVGIMQHDYSLTGGASVMSIIASTMIYSISKKSK